MSDIALPRALPASAVPGTTAGATAANASAGVSNLPRALANLAVSSQIEGVVSERVGRNVVLVLTDKGTLTLHTGLALKPGVAIKLQVQTLGPHMRVIILAIDGKPLSGAGAGARTPVGSTPAALTPGGSAAASAPAASPGGSAAPSATSQPGPTVAASAPGAAATNPAATSAISKDTITTQRGTPQTAAAQSAPQAGAASAGAASGTQIPGAALANAGSAGAVQPGATAPPSAPLTSVNGPLAPGMTVVATVMQPSGAVTGTPGSTVLLMAENFTAAGRETPASPTSSDPAAASPSHLAAGSRLVVRIAAIGGAAPSPGGVANANPQASPVITTPLPAASAVAAADVLTIHGAVTNAALSTNPANAAANANAAGATPGSTQVQTPLGVVSLPTAQPLPANTPLTLEILGTFSDRAGREPIPGLVRQQTLHAFSKTWPALRQAIDTLRQAEAETVLQTFGQAIPRLGPTLANGILFFIAALRTGSVRGWLGDGAAAALESAGRGDLLTQLGNDFALLGRIAGEHQESGWQTMLIPVYDGDKLHQIRMFMRKHGRDNSDDGETESRFVIETELSRLGLIQLDGLINKTQFDLVVRSRKDLPKQIQTDIKTIFLDALVTAELGGGIKFTVKPDFEFSPPEDMDEGALDHGVGVVV